MTKWFHVSMETKLQCQIDGKMRSIQIYMGQIVMLKQCEAMSPQVWGGCVMMSGRWERTVRTMSKL